MLSNPKCPKCDTNQRVIASYKMTHSQVLAKALNVPLRLEPFHYQCNSCNIPFKGNQTKEN